MFLSNREAVEELVVLLRGFFATPAISSLGRLGVLDQMRSQSEFQTEDFAQIKNKKLLRETFNYFSRLGLIVRSKSNPDIYTMSDLGAVIFRRANSFYVPHSYFDYMYKFHEMIQLNDGAIVPEVERLENVVGSGITHQRYFPPAISFLKRNSEFETLVDLGCGNGDFLLSVLQSIPERKLIGIDMSEISTSTTSASLSLNYPNADFVTFCCDGSDINLWSKLVLSHANSKSFVFSMWFFIQEISNNDPSKIIDFLRKLKEIFPEAPIVIGEMVQQSDDILVKNNHKSLIPEYLFFHEMSNQGVLTWQDYKEILSQTGYQIEVEKLYDEVVAEDGQNVPSTFIWCLTPRKDNHGY